MTPDDRFLAAGMAGEFLDLLGAAQPDAPVVAAAVEVAADAARDDGDGGT